jgi:hypothetical protein
MPALKVAHPKLYAQHLCARAIAGQRVHKAGYSRNAGLRPGWRVPDIQLRVADWKMARDELREDLLGSD